jgi:hypothetical protein
MALRDWIYRFDEPAVAVPAVIAVQKPENERKTAKTATTATAKAGKVAVDLATPTGPRTVTVSGNTAPDRTTPGDLPEGCPLDGWPFPATGCRFHRRIFERLTAEGVLPPGGPCPLRAVCRVGR